MISVCKKIELNKGKRFLILLIPKKEHINKIILQLLTNNNANKKRLALALRKL